MGRITITALRIVIALCLIGSLFAQTVIVPLFWADLEGEALWGRIALVVIIVLGILTMQVSAVCVWMLLSMVRKGSVFSTAAFRYVDVIFGAVVTASVLAFILAAALAPGGIAPGVVGLIAGLALAIAGVALVVLVLRMLLAQAIARDVEVGRLRSELNEVI
ncbi:DUF2975 domain-containing protein [Microbacterium sp. 4R-513]|uniref:DUF2975 domain-containing protein n=1 Tax=Microbacterium sp. 4R-513 TaxID=2567934 RepID=UPI0013E17A12|nr:DUF2975 domain-containing protein [Microbacterium sp. 4R-513]QIG39006.1 DUF2975 domain-containing protein [Microbacterium sp. 4R-513]